MSRRLSYLGSNDLLGRMTPFLNGEVLPRKIVLQASCVVATLEWGHLKWLAALLCYYHYSRLVDLTTSILAMSLFEQLVGRLKHKEEGISCLSYHRDLPLWAPMHKCKGRKKPQPLVVDRSTILGIHRGSSSRLTSKLPWLIDSLPCWALLPLGELSCVLFIILASPRGGVHHGSNDACLEDAPPLMAALWAKGCRAPSYSTYRQSWYGSRHARPFSRCAYGSLPTL